MRSHPSAAVAPDPAAAEQSSAWLVYQTDPGADVCCEGRSWGRAMRAGWRQEQQRERRRAGGVRRPGTCAGRGQGCPEPRSAAARGGTQYSGLWYKAKQNSNDNGNNNRLAANARCLLGMS